VAKLLRFHSFGADERAVSSTVFHTLFSAVLLLYSPRNGVPTTLAFSRSKSKKSQDFIPFGQRSQIYGEFLPPEYQTPSSSRVSAMIRAFSLDKEIIPDRLKMLCRDFLI